MKLETEFTLTVPPEQAWRVLSDVAALADAIPGGGLRDAHGVYTGRIELDLDGRRIPVAAALRAIDADADERVATMELSGRQLDGPAIGSATLRSRVEPVESGARVCLCAEVLSSGHDPASATVQAAADRLLEQVAEGLRKRALAEPLPAAAEPAADRPRELALDASTSATVPSAPADRRARGLIVAGAGAGALLVLAVIRSVRRGRR